MAASQCPTQQPTLARAASPEVADPCTSHAAGQYELTHHFHDCSRLVSAYTNTSHPHNICHSWLYRLQPQWPLKTSPCSFFYSGELHSMLSFPQTRSWEHTKRAQQPPLVCAALSVVVRVCAQQAVQRVCALAGRPRHSTACAFRAQRARDTQHTPVSHTACHRSWPCKLTPPTGMPHPAGDAFPVTPPHLSASYSSHSQLSAGTESRRLQQSKE